VPMMIDAVSYFRMKSGKLVRVVRVLSGGIAPPEAAGVGFGLRRCGKCDR